MTSPSWSWLGLSLSMVRPGICHFPAIVCFRICIACWSMLMKAALQFPVGNSNVWLISVLIVLSWLSLCIKVVIFLVLGMMRNFQSRPGHLGHRVRRQTSSVLADGHPVQVCYAGLGLLLWVVVLMTIWLQSLCGSSLANLVCLGPLRSHLSYFLSLSVSWRLKGFPQTRPPGTCGW